MGAGTLLTASQRRLAGSWTPEFNRFTLAHTLAAAGDTFVTVSLAGSLFFSLSPSASQQQTLLYLAITMVPFSLIAPLIGPAVDRLQRGRKWVATGLFSIRSVTALALAFTLYSLMFYLFVLVILIANKASGITKQALVPTLVAKPGHLVSANSRLARMGTLGGAIAAPIGAGLMAATGAPVILGLACASFGGSAAATAMLRTRRSVDEEEANPIVEYRQTHDATLVATGWAYSVIRLSVGFFIFGTAFALRRTSEPAWVYGAAAALYALGVFAGNAVAPALRRRHTEDRLVAGSLFALAIVAILGAVQAARPIVLLVAAVLGLSTAVGKQGFDALVQIRTDPALQGRTFARFETRFQIGWVLGALIATAVAIPMSVSLVVLALTLIPATLWYERSVRQIARLTRDGPTDLLALASLRIIAARSWHLRGDDRVAVTELRSGLDLALVSGAVVDVDLRGAVTRLREDVIAGRPFDRAQVPDLIDRLDRLVTP